MDVFGLAALGLVAAEWLALGAVSGVDWPSSVPTLWAARWGLRLLVGAGLIGVAPLVPLLEAWLYLHRGGVSIDAGKTIWSLVGSAFGVCLSQHLRLSLAAAWHWLAPWLGAAIVVSASGLLEGFWTGQADLALTAYLTMASLAIVQWQRAPDKRWLIQAAIFGAATALTKFEGLPRIGVLVVAALVGL